MTALEADGFYVEPPDSPAGLTVREYRRARHDQREEKAVSAPRSLPTTIARRRSAPRENREQLVRRPRARWRVVLLALVAAGILAGGAPEAALGQTAGAFEVRDAVGQFNALKHHGEAIGWRLLEDQGAPDPSVRDHYQGVARYPATGTPVFYVTQLDDDDPALPGAPDIGGYLLVARMGTRPTTGERLRSNLQQLGKDTDETAPSALDTWVRSIRFDGSLVVDGQSLPAYEHPGGMAIVDDVLLMALDTPRSSGSPAGQIVLFDLRPDREDPRAIQALPLDHKIDHLAATRQPDGSLSIWVNGDGGKVTRFYSTSTPDLRNPNLSLTLLQDWTPVDLVNEVNAVCEGNDWPEDSDAFQAATFVRRAGGGLFLAMTRNTTAPNFGCDLAELFRLDRLSDGDFQLVRVASKHQVCNFAGSGRICSFGAASGAYVSPSGELILYSVPHDDQDGFDPDVVRMAEFRHRDVSTEDSPLRRPSADAGGPYMVDEGATVGLSGTGRLRADRPWFELFDLVGKSIVVDFEDRHLLELNDLHFLDGDPLTGFNDATTSVRWRSPVGLDIELYDDAGFTDRHIVLKGTGQTEEIVDLGSQVVVPGVVEHPGRSAGEELDFNDKTSSARWAGAPASQSLAFEWDLDEDGQFDDSNIRSPLFGPKPDDGAVTVRLRVTDSLGEADTDAATVTVRNVAPRIESAKLTNPLGAEIGAGGGVALPRLPLTLDVTFTDPGVADTQTATVDWGDGTVDTSFDSYSDARSGALGRLRHRHAYAAPGVYEIVTTITDDDGGTTKVTTTVEVLSPAKAIRQVADELTDLIDGETDPAIRAALHAARDDLIGNHGGTPPTNGALDKLEAGDPVAAITKLQSTISNLALAETRGAGDLSTIKDLLGLVAEALAAEAHNDAQVAVAPPGPGEARQLGEIAALIETGHQQLATAQYAGACERFRQATAKALKLTG